jgi:hypothetical protein
VLATSEGKLDQTLAQLDKLPGDRDAASKARIDGLNELMSSVGLEAFPTIEELGKSSSVEEVRAAVAAPGRMLKPGVKERDKACPWLRGFLSHQDIVVATIAVRAIGELCPHGLVEAIVDAGEKRLTENALDDDFVEALAALCDPQSAIAKKRGTPQRACERMFTLFQKVARDGKLPVLPRAVALRALSNRPTQETLDFCREMAAEFARLKRRPPANFDFRLGRAAGECITLTSKRLAEKT